MLRIHCKIALCFLISLFDLSAILKIRNGEHAHYVGLVVAYTWNREKQMFVALGREFDMLRQIAREIMLFLINNLNEKGITESQDRRNFDGVHFIRCAP